MSHVGGSGPSQRSQTFNVGGSGQQRFMSDRQRDAAIQEAMYNPGGSNLPNVDCVDDDDDMIPMDNMYNNPSHAGRTLNR